MSSGIRITGMATGLDVDSMVKQMMKAENMRVDKLKQGRQVVQWKQDMFRDIIKDFMSFKSSYFDVLKPENYMLSSNSYSGFDVSDSSNTSVLKATANAGAISGTYQVKDITIASKASASGDKISVKQVENQVSFPVSITAGTNNIISFSIHDTAANTDKTYDVKISDGASSYGSLSELVQKINSSLTKATPSGGGAATSIIGQVQAKLSNDGTKIEFQASSNYTINSATTNGGADIKPGMAFDINVQAGINDELSISVVDDLTNTSKQYKLNIAAGSYATLNDYKNAISSALQAAVPAGGGAPVNLTSGGAAPTNVLDVDLSFDGNRIKFTGKTVSNTISVSGNAAKSVGFASNNTTIGPSFNDKMSSIFNTAVNFTINGKNLSYDFSQPAGAHKDWTITQVMNDISSAAGVRISYSELGRKFSLESVTTGEDQSITATEAGVGSDVFLKTLFGSSSISKQGTDATATITDPKGNSSFVKKSSNSFAIDGVTYNLLQSTAPADHAPITFSVKANEQKVFDKIKGFIEKYNEIIDKVNDKLIEKRQYNYTPLTDDQKKEMKEEEIKTWEEKAKQGLLKSDSALSNMLMSMREAFYRGVEGAGITLGEIGLSTSSDISQKGKIIIDEAKLRNAISNNGSQVADLFMKQSSKVPMYNSDLTTLQRDDRNSDQGIFQRVNDILQDNLRTLRDSNNRKGILLEKAGIKGDYSEFHNFLSEDIDKKDKVIQTVMSKLADKENRYYSQFAKLESAMQKMNQQSGWLSQQLGSMGGN